MSEPAPYELAQTLHGLVADALVQRLKGTPSVNELAVARGFLKDNAVVAESDEDHARLRELDKLFMDRLMEGMSQPSPPASLLDVVYQYLRHNGVELTGKRAISAAEAFAALADVSLPFKP